MGAAIAMTVAAQPETQIAGLGLLACGDTLPIPNEVPDLLISSFETAVEQIVAASSSSQTSAKMRQTYKSHLLKSEPDVLRDDFVAARTFRAEPFAARLPIPTVILAGEEDAMVPTPRSRALHLLTPNSKLKVFSGAGHMLHWEREHETIQALQSLIQDM